jgi:signal transduction histidine kinase
MGTLMDMGGQQTRLIYRTAWRELGRLGRVAFFGVLLSGIVAVSLGFLVPSVVRDHLVTARVDELQRAVDSVVEAAAPSEFVPGADLSNFAEAARLRLLGGDIVRVKLWDSVGRILWSDEERLIGRRFNMQNDLAQAFDGEISVEETALTDAENEFERDFGPLIEFYLPIGGSDGDIAAVFEVYQRLEPFNDTLMGVRTSTWIRIGSGLGVLSLFMGALTLVTMRGVERRRQESEILLRRSLEVREAERVRLATALHDDVGQPLYRLLYGLEALKDSQLDPGDAAAEAERLSELVRGVDDTLRDEMRRLQTSPVDEQGLRTSLLALATNGDLPPLINIELAMDRGFGSAAEEILYRSAREAVANAAKHSGAMKIDVRLRDLGDTAVLTVVDDGEWRHGPEGLGIATVRGMLEAVGGDLDIRSKDGDGTTVVARVPLKVEGR